MHRRPMRVGLALVASLAAVTMAWNPVLGSSTRVVFFGSPGTTVGGNGLGVLTTTDVTAGGATATDILLQNLSPSTLTHVAIQGGAAAPDPLANPGFPAPDPICPAGATSSSQCLPSLPPGTTYLAAYVSPASTVGVSCTQSATSVSCAVNNMKPNDVAQIRLIVQPPSSPGSNVDFWLATSLKEGTSNSGSNQDTFFANGKFGVLAPGCPEVANFFQRGQDVRLSNTTNGPCNQATIVSSTGTYDQGTFESVGSSSNVLYCAPGIKSCFGEMSLANVNFGIQPSGYVLWDIVWTGADLPSGTPKGVTHFADNYNPQTNSPTPVSIYFKPASHCSSVAQVYCWESTNSTRTSFEAKFRTPNNGGSRGF